MPYFKNNDVNILLIHIPKTGGTSLEYYFSKEYNIKLNEKSLFMFLNEETKKQNNIEINSSLQHITYQTIIKYKDFFNIDFNNLKIITIVRNPYERIISDLFFFFKINKNSSKEHVFNVIKNYLLDNKLDNHNIPQYCFITNENKQIIPNTHILHTENLTNDMYNLGYTNFKNHINTNYQVNPSSINYYDYLNNDSINLINDFYHYDFELFNYKKK